MSDIKLSEQELEQIQNQRKKQTDADNLKKAATEAEAKKEEIKQNTIQRMIATLVKEDINNILTVDDDEVTFECPGKKTVIIEEHKVFDGWHSRSKGFKYKLSGSFNGYKNMYYKNPKTVIKRIEEFQKIEKKKNEKALLSKSFNDQALTELAEIYPNAVLELEEGHYKQGRFGKTWVRTTIRVRSTTCSEGWIQFSFRENNGEMEFSMYKMNVQKSIEDDVVFLILNN